MNTEACPPADRLAELVEGALAAEAAGEVHRHVRGCTRCRLVLAGLGAAVEQMADDDTIESDPLVMKPGVQVNRFRLERMLGRGGMGTVWAAADPELGRQVAIKVLSIGAGSEGDRVASRSRLLREAKAMARLSHPNVVPVFEIDEVRGRLFLVMELVEGQTLAHWLKEPRTLNELLEKFIAAGDGLAAAHAAGVVHRDFKPENVLVGNDGRARVTDFGLARGHLQGEIDGLRSFAARDVPGSSSVNAVGEGKPPRSPAAGLVLPSAPTPGPDTRELANTDTIDPSPQRAADGGLPFDGSLEIPSAGGATLPSALTPMGALLGTPAYMSPEQMRGQRADARSDIFAFCTALFEGLYGRRPYPAKTLLSLRNAIEADQIEWPRAPSVPGWLRRELAKGLRADPQQRHASMSQLLAVLRRRRVSQMERRLWIAPLIALALILAVGTIGLVRRANAQKLARSVAVLAPHNNGPAGASWIGSALAEMITSELKSDGSLRMVSPTEVTSAEADLSLKGALPSAADVAHLRTRLGSDLLLGGTYQRDENGKLVCELTLWDANGGATLLSAEGDEAHLVDLGANLGEQLRRALGMRAKPAQAPSGFPANVDAARLYTEGLQLLRTYHTVQAVEPLQTAGALAPENPRIQLALAEAYASMHHDGAAREAAQRAEALKSALPPDEQTRTDILYFLGSGDDARAIELARKRYEQGRNELQNGLDYGDVLIRTNHPKDVLALVAELRKLAGPAGSDARVDILQATACQLTGDLKCIQAASERAFKAADSRGATWQKATALSKGGYATRKLGDVDKGLAMLIESQKLYREVGDRGGMVSSQVTEGTIYADRGDIPRARAIFDQAITTYQAIGDRKSEGATTHNLAVLMRRARDYPSAIIYATRAVSINQETRQEGPEASSRAVLGNLRLDMGDLNGAVEMLTRALELRRKNNAPQLISSLIALGVVRVQQADWPEVHKLIDEMKAVDNDQEKLTSGRVLAFTGVVALDEGRCEEAARDLGKAVDIFMSITQLDEVPLNAADQAEALLSLGRTAEARAAIERSRAVLAKTKGRIGKTETAIVLGRLSIKENPGAGEAAVKQLRQYYADEEAALPTDEKLSIRIAIAELENASRMPGAKEHLLAIVRDAKAQGYLEAAHQAAVSAALIRR